MPVSSTSSTRTSTIGRSPEMPCDHKVGGAARPRRIASGEERSAGLA